MRTSTVRAATLRSTAARAASPVVDHGRTEQDLAAEIASLPRGRVPSELRRRHALVVGTELFLERGYAGTSMDDVAERCGISKPVLYGLVGSKEQLFADVMARASDELAERISTAAAAETEVGRRVHAGALAFFRFVEERHDAWRTLLTPGVTGSGNELANLRSQQVEQVRDLLMGDVAASAGLDPTLVEAAAHAVAGANEALAALWQSRRIDVSAEDLAALVTLLFQPGLSGLGDLLDPEAVHSAAEHTTGAPT